MLLTDMDLTASSIVHVKISHSMWRDWFGTGRWSWMSG